MIYKRNISNKQYAIDEDFLSESSFIYRTYMGMLFIENKDELRLDGEKNEWCPSSMKQLDLTKFPLIEDFSVELHLSFSRGEFRDSESLTIHFKSKKHGILVFTDFMTRFVISDTSVPTGKIDQPYSDSDQCYHLVIFSHEKFVYILFGNPDIDFNRYTTWFKVPAERYAEAWIDVKKWYALQASGEMATLEP